MAMKGYLSLCMPMLGCVCLCWVVYAYVGLCMAMKGYLSLCMPMLGCVCLCRVMYGHVGLCSIIINIRGQIENRPLQNTRSAGRKRLTAGC